MTHHPAREGRPVNRPVSPSIIPPGKIGVLILTALLSLNPSLSEAQTQQQTPPCGPRALIVEQLKREFSETPVSRGLASNGTIIELLVSEAGTWTLLVSLPNGNSCFGAVGEMWQAVEPPAPKGETL